MHQIDNASAATTIPPIKAPGPPGYFTAGNPAVGQQATIVEADWMNMAQEELCNVVRSAGLTLNKADNTQLLAALRRLFLQRITVAADSSVYVNTTTGNDSNDGRTAGSAFKTIPRAIDSVYNDYDWNGFACDIKLADGVYQDTVNGYGARFVGMPIGMGNFSQLSMTGNPASPTSVVIQIALGNAVLVWGGTVKLTGITLRAGGTLNTIYESQGVALMSSAGGWVDCVAMRFETCGLMQVAVQQASVVTLGGTTNVFTGTTQWTHVVTTGGLLWQQGSTINVNGLSFSAAFADASQCGVYSTVGAAFVGSATGQRYRASTNGVIQTGSGGANFLPGTVAGVASSGGQYV